MASERARLSLLQNWISLAGTAIASVVFTAILVLIGLDLWYGSPNPYLGIITYLALPAVLSAGLFLIVLGVFLERSRRRRMDPVAVKPFPAVDLNLKTHRRAFYVVLAVSTVFLIFSAFGSYRAYHFTESVVFCGQTCHQVMEPEFTAYKHSPHARVACVQCHIGPGADWFVKSKLSGAYQVYSVLFNRYHKPIKTPIKNLRPAQETCEQCHWPQQFFGAVENDHRYFLSDEKNSPWQTRMLVLVGGGERMAGERKGIHWHMNIANKVYYVAEDEKRQVIPWVKVVRPNGEETIYVDEESDYTADQPPQGELRRMDCIDCHNRPSHNFKSPQRAVNNAMALGAIDKELPYVKREALRILAKKYATKEEGLEAIETGLHTFYKEYYPEVLAASELKAAIATIKDIFLNNFFPSMGVSWQVYPENIGHLTAPGCFRCHNGHHRSTDGKVIDNACNSCHLIVAQGPPDVMESSLEGLPFRHPGDSEEIWKEMICSDCHTGGPM